MTYIGRGGAAAETRKGAVTVIRGDHFAAIDAGDGMSIGLHPMSKHGPEPGTRGSISVGLNATRSLDEVVATLKSRGVELSGPIQEEAEGGIRLAFLGDPDGHDLSL